MFGMCFFHHVKQVSLSWAILQRFFTVTQTFFVKVHLGSVSASDSEGVTFKIKIGHGSY